MIFTSFAKISLATFGGGIAIFGHFALSIALLLDMPWEIFGVLQHLLFLIVTALTIISILQYNGTLSSWWTRIGVGLLTLIFIGIQSLFVVRRKRV